MMEMASVSTAIILAGGKGTRLRSIVSDVPKPMASINGRPFLEYQLDYLAQNGMERVILAVGYMAEVVQEYFGNRWNGMQILYSIETKVLGTGGALIKASRLLEPDEHTLVLNGDTYFPITLSLLVEQHFAKQSDMTIAMFQSTNSQRYSSFKVDDDGRARFNDSATPSYCSGGIYIFSTKVISYLRAQKINSSSFESQLMHHFFDLEFSVFAYFEACFFIDIGLPQDYKRANNLFAQLSSKI